MNPAQNKEEAVSIDRYPPAPLQYACLYTDENVQNAEWRERLAPPVPIDGPYLVCQVNTVGQCKVRTFSADVWSTNVNE